MPRTKRKIRDNEHECRACGKVFIAVRCDARYCGPTCRQKISRAMRAAATMQVRRGRKVDADWVECRNCGTLSQINAVGCFACGVKFKKVK